MTATRKRRTRRTVIRVDDATLPHSSIVQGPIRVVGPYLERLRIPRQYDNLLHAYKIPKRRLDDLAAAMELDGYRVDIEMPGWS